MMLKDLWVRIRHWAKALAYMEDPVGEYISGLEARVTKLEREVDQLRAGGPL
jgi:hypothetical protein